MNLQDVFYIIGIIFMTLYTILLIVIVVLLFYIKQKLTETYEQVEKKLEMAKDVITHPKEIAANVGSAIVEMALDKVTRLLKTKKEK